MSLFQCAKCGCRENTALSCQGFLWTGDFFDWTGLEEWKGQKLCSACGPTKYAKGEPSEYGKWHDEFPRRFLPKGQYITCPVGNLIHKDTRLPPSNVAYSDTEYSSVAPTAS